MKKKGHNQRIISIIALVLVVTMILSTIVFALI